MKYITIEHEDTFSTHTAVIPAKAGIHRKILLFQMVVLDPRLRGDDIRGK